MLPEKTHLESFDEVRAKTQGSIQDSVSARFRNSGHLIPCLYCKRGTGRQSGSGQTSRELRSEIRRVPSLHQHRRADPQLERKDASQELLEMVRAWFGRRQGALSNKMHLAQH